MRYMDGFKRARYIPASTRSSMETSNVWNTILIPLRGATPRPSPTAIYAGSAPGLAAGIFQINFVAPQPGMTALNLTAGTATTGFSLTVQ